MTRTTTKPLLAVGDRVRVYGTFPSVDRLGALHCDGDIGVVGKVHQSGWVGVEIPNWGAIYASPKQCRRLRPKAKPVAREWWLGRSPRTGDWKVFYSDPSSLVEPPGEIVHVTETPSAKRAKSESEG